MTILTFDIGGSTIKTGLFDESGKLVSVDECPTEASSGVPALIRKLCNIASQPKYRNADRIGISSTGQVDPQNGTIVFATESMPGYAGTPLKHLMEEFTGLPVSLNNDGNCAAIGEARFGAGQDYKDFLCIAYGTGIGGAVIIDGKLYYGATGIAGELGHMITHAGGRQCVCGKRGCYEMYASTSALIREVSSATGETLNGKEIFSRFDEPEIRPVIDRWIDEIVYGLVSLAHIFNPQCFILGGGILNESYPLDEIAARLNMSVIKSFIITPVRHAQLGNKAGLYGAFYNAMQL